jgi:Ni/Fe-hydrogenase subunit HybB-like protein
MTLSPRLKSIFAFVWYLSLLLIIIAGLIAGAQVLTKGLWLTNLTDLVPWGLWITIDLSSIAVSAGAFSLCAVVYLVGLKQYEPVARTATFIGIIGYSMAMLCLLMDIGRPDRFWHGFVFWNTHSVLWEVTMCVGLYFSVLLIEVLPIIGGSDIMRRISPWLSDRLSSIHHFSPILAIFGLAFSLLHQSSLGATYGVLQARPAWYRPNLSVLFIYSAVLAGISLTIFASMLAARVSSKANVKDDLLEKLSHAVGWGLLGYLYFRFWDMFAVTYTYQPGRTEGFKMLTSGSLAYTFWVGEVLLGAVIPVFILLNKRLRKNPTYRMAALIMIVLGVIAYRWDVNLVGQLIVLTYLPGEIVARYTDYFPSLIEIAAGAGVIAFGLFAFSFGVQVFGIVDHRSPVHHPEHEPVAVGTITKPLPKPASSD